MLTPDFFRGKFESAQGYEAYVAGGSADQQENWRRILDKSSLTPSQRDLVAGFTRRVNVLVSSGLWCGDCVQQCPMLRRIEEANPRSVALRFVDRDRHLDLSEPLKICGGLRVPTVIFLNEDFDFVSILGDRTLSRYRAIAARQLGAACPLPGAEVPSDEMTDTVQDWVNEFERVHLLLRLSGKLRTRHGD
jgi:thiol-disulfide isomerase/thioredoxin